MERGIDALDRRTYDIVVIGGGIYGACIARDAALRGLRVALIERGDFGQETSYNSLKLIHGGLRYLQHFDLPRVRECIRERNYWLKTAPHLIRPLEVLIPTYGHKTRGREALWSATRVYNALAVDRNRGLSAEQFIPAARIVSRAECKRRIPGIDPTYITGGCSWTDGQMHNAARVVLECVQDAVDAGADAANYVKARQFMIRGSHVQGVRAYDLLGRRQLEIRARLVINASGPWLASVLEPDIGAGYHADLPLSRALNVITRPLLANGAVGVASQRASDSAVGHSKRLYFITPWRGLSIVGTTHLPFDDHADAYRIVPTEVQAFIDEINEAYPPARLTMADVIYCYGGLTPAAGVTREEVRRARGSRIIDHAREDGMDGIVSVSGVKFTSARDVAEQTVDFATRRLGENRQKCPTREKPLPGARDFTDRATLRERIRQRLGPRADSAAMDCLEDYGMRYERVLKAGNGEVDAQSILEARCRYAVREEMARSLTDIVMRRTTMAERGLLTETALQTCATVMARELGWRDAEVTRQTQIVRLRLAEAAPGYASGDEQTMDRDIVRSG